MWTHLLFSSLAHSTGPSFFAFLNVAFFCFPPTRSIIYIEVKGCLVGRWAYYFFWLYSTRMGEPGKDWITGEILKAPLLSWELMFLFCPFN